MSNQQSDIISELEKTLLEANAHAEELNVNRLEHMNSNQEMRDYRPFTDALKKLVEYPRLTGYTCKPSEIELMVKEVHDKIEAKYKHDWELYDCVQAVKREAVATAFTAARDAQIKLSTAKKSCY